MDGNTSTGRGAVNRGVHLDPATDRLLSVMAGRRYDGNASMAVRAAIRLAAQTWGIEAPPKKDGET